MKVRHLQLTACSLPGVLKPCFHRRNLIKACEVVPSKGTGPLGLKFNFSHFYICSHIRTLMFFVQHAVIHTQSSNCIHSGKLHSYYYSILLCVLIIPLSSSSLNTPLNTYTLLLYIFIKVRSIRSNSLGMRFDSYDIVGPIFLSVFLSFLCSLLAISLMYKVS